MTNKLLQEEELVEKLIADLVQTKRAADDEYLKLKGIVDGETDTVSRYWTSAQLLNDKERLRILQLQINRIDNELKQCDSKGKRHNPEFEKKKWNLEGVI